MTKRQKFDFLLAHFQSQIPDAETELQYQNSFQLLVAVILSAQCTDKRVNLVTPALFEHFPDAESLSHSHFDEVFPLIKSISYPNNKTKHLIGMAQVLMEKFHGLVPDSVEDLQKLPGVGRKTANVIASVIFNQPTMAVDTHVFRVSHRLGLVPASAKTPLAVEMALYQFIPEKWIHKAHHWLILHGRYICTARKPHCNLCGLITICSFVKKSNLAIKKKGQ